MINNAPNAYGELVESLLDDPRHGKRWAKFWLDLARYAGTAGHGGDPDLPHAWHYRDHVIDSFDRDKPYDEFIREQIAGGEGEEIMGAGELPPAKPEQAVALTLLRLAPFTEPRGDGTRHEMLMQSFDGLVGEDSVPERRLSVTALQALEMYNGGLVNEEVKHVAARVIKDAGDDPQRRVERAFAIALDRAPTAAPEIVDLAGEPESIQKLHGLDRDKTAGFGRQCLLARRLVERGVLYTRIINGVQIGGDSCDHHGKVRVGMIKKSCEVDPSIAGLLEDLKQRDLLEGTLVVRASEMGCTPFVNGSAGGTPGREHHACALCIWTAGGDVKGGATAGQTDDYSLRSVGERVHIRDVDATILDLMGLNDAKLNYLHACRIRRLTDIGGHVIAEIIG